MSDVAGFWLGLVVCEWGSSVLNKAVYGQVCLSPTFPVYQS